MKQSRPLRRRLLALLGLVLAALVVLRLFGVQILPTRWLVAAWVLDIVLGLAELVVVLAAARAFRDGVREGGVVRGYERWIDKEEELGLPRPLARAARMELRLYQAIGRAVRRGRSRRARSGRAPLPLAQADPVVQPPEERRRPPVPPPQ